MRAFLLSVLALVAVVVVAGQPIEEIYVKNLDGKIIAFKVDLDKTVAELKNKIFEEEKLSQDKQQLIFRGKIVTDEKSLADHDIRRGAYLHLVLRPSEAFETTNERGQPIEEIYVKNLNGKIIAFNVDLDKTVAELKNKIFEEEKLSQDKQQLIFRGKIVTDEKSLADHGIRRGAFLHLVLRPSEADKDAN